MRKLNLLAAAALATLAVPASATITFNPNQGAIQPEENVVFQAGNDVDGQTVFGVTNNTNTTVQFSTLTGQTLTTPSQGQARIEAVDGSLTSLMIALGAPNMTFDSIEFNLFDADPETTVTIVGMDQFGQEFTYNSTLGNGQNFFIGFTDDTQSISSVSFTTTGGGVADIRQIRIGGISMSSAVPEPATWAMMLSGFGAVGYSMRSRKRTQKIQAA